MCRNIRPLFNFEPPATPDEIGAAALHYVRKVSGYSKVPAANEAAFDRAVQAVAEATAELVASLVTAAPPKDRDVELQKRRALNRKRFGP